MSTDQASSTTRAGRGTLAAVAVVTLVHAGLTVAAIAFGFGLTMERFDSGAEASTVERGLDVAVAVLMFPLGHLAMLVPGWFPGPAGYLPLLANGAAWAIPLVAGWRWLRRRQRPISRTCR